MSILVKVCGITSEDDALAAAEAGADLLGFIFYPPSPRSVTPEQARRIVDALRRSPYAAPERRPGRHQPGEPGPERVLPPPALVGVFVDEDLATVRHVLGSCGLDIAQLHGMEPPQAVANLMASGTRVFKAFRVRAGASLSALQRYQATAYLLDAYVAGRPGGTGQTFDWELAVQAKRHGRIILSGGLTPDNVAAAVDFVQPYAVDVASGVESGPGRKDHDKVRRFVAAAKDCAWRHG
jgi:phosphoribosylanthranilate isomerase